MATGGVGGGRALNVVESRMGMSMGALCHDPHLRLLGLGAYGWQRPVTPGHS